MNGTEEEINRRVDNIKNIKVGDELNVTIKQIDEMGFFVTMNQYNEEGFIRKFSNKNNKKYNVGTEHIARVIRIDHTLGYTDLEFLTPKQKYC